MATYPFLLRSKEEEAAMQRITRGTCQEKKWSGVTPWLLLSREEDHMYDESKVYVRPCYDRTKRDADIALLSRYPLHSMVPSGDDTREYLYRTEVDVNKTPFVFLFATLYENRVMRFSTLDDALAMIINLFDPGTTCIDYQQSKTDPRRVLVDCREERVLLTWDQPFFDKDGSWIPSEYKLARSEYEAQWRVVEALKNLHEIQEKLVTLLAGPMLDEAMPRKEEKPALDAWISRVTGMHARAFHSSMDLSHESLVTRCMYLTALEQHMEPATFLHPDD